MFIMLALIFAISVGAVNASDLNQNDAVDAGDLTPKSFYELNETIYCHVGSVVECDLDTDYAFSEESDGGFVGGIEIAGNTTINGNGHVIDCKNKAVAFHLNHSILYVNDLTLKNGNPNMIFIEAGKCVLNNVTFICDDSDSKENIFIRVFGESDEYGLNLTCSELNVTNCGFYSTALHNADILSSAASVSIKDSVFDGGDVSNNGHIMANDETQLDLDNVTFNNLKSKYATAIYANTYWLTVRNSRFTNLSANMTAGAIGIKYSNFNSKRHAYVIENCIFENTGCLNDGGAIFFDAAGLNGNGIEDNATMNVSNSRFINCTSSFGGAIVQLSGLLNIANSTFDDNFALSCGGAVYTADVEAHIIDSTFTNNVALYHGGALFHNCYNLYIDNSTFTDNGVLLNTSDSANAIYSYNSLIKVENSYFKNGGVGIYTVFDDFSENNNTYVGDTVSTDNTDYEYFIGLHADPIKFLNNEINVENLPSKFDLRDWGWVSPIGNQGYMGSCWAFGSVSAIESAIRKATGLNYMVSVNNMHKMELMYSKYGATYLNEGGSAINGIAYVLSWLGVQLGDSDVYDDLGKLSDIIYDSNVTVHVQDVIVIPGSSNQTQKVKEAILKYGALSVDYCSSMSFPPEYNDETYAFYGNSTFEDGQPRLPNHVVSIIGWDDSFSKENFLITPPDDGAWIIKNSWGTDWGDNGYFYLSYYEPSLMYGDNPDLLSGAVGYIFENKIQYHLNYQTDFAGLYQFDGNYSCYSNEYESIFNELIGAVGTYFREDGIEYELKVYVNGELRHTQIGVSEFTGFRTIILDKYVPVKVNDKFKVEFRSNSVPFATPSRRPIDEGISMVSDGGEEWMDSSLLEMSVCLKAYTVIDDSKIINNKDISVDYAGGKYFSVKVVTDDGHAVGAGEVVKFNINGKPSTVKTDSNGVAKVKITQTPGKYTIKTVYNGKTYSNKVTVKQVLTASKVTVKKTAKSFTLKAKLKINGKLVKGKTVTFKFNGKTYKIKTNSKGIAQKTLNKNVINKLKKGKTYTVKVTYSKDTVKTTVKVSR